MNEYPRVISKKVSIIIPHYNSAALLKKLLDSIPVNDEIEVIVIDDNSTDAEEYDQLKAQQEHSNVTFLKNNRGPKGAGTCRNIGLSAASGDWLLFADSDDYFIQGFYDVIKQYFDCDYDVIFFTPTSEDLLAKGKSNRHEFFEQLINDSLNNKDYKSELLIRYRFVVPWSKLIRRKLVVDHNIEFDEIIVSNDVMFSTKTGYAMGKYLTSKEVIYCVTRGKGTLTRTMNEAIFFIRLDTFIRRCVFLRERLDEKSYEMLRYTGRGKLADCILYNLGVRNTIKTYIKLHNNKIKIWSGLNSSPVQLYKNVNKKVKTIKQIKKYF